MTPGGIHVRNVAQAVIGHAYNVYRLTEAREGTGIADTRLDRQAAR